MPVNGLTSGDAIISLPRINWLSNLMLVFHALQ
jgi:hypothetical protein